MVLDVNRHIFASIIALLAAFAISFGADISARAQTTVGPPRDANGWTIFKRSADTRVIYASNSSGNDRNDGLSERTPVKTIARGVALLRDRHPDWLLLKKGDTWTNEAFGYGTKTGRSDTEPMLISSYGAGSRPLIKTTSVKNAGTAIGSLGRPGSRGDFLAIVGLEFYAYTRDPNSPDFDASTVGAEHNGLNFLVPVTWFLIEDCKFSFYRDQSIQAVNGRSLYVTFRRNVIANSYSTNSHSQGLFVSGIDHLLIEENVFDHNGWNPSVPGANPTVFNHNVYIHQGNGQATIRGNIFANASSHGVQARPGGVIIDNFYVRNAISLLVGSAQNSTINKPSIVKDNVFMEGKDIAADLPRGMGVDLGPKAGTVEVTSNIFAHNVSSKPYGSAIFISPQLSGNRIVNNIIYDWGQGPAILDKGVDNTTSPNAINLRDYPNPTRTVETYNASLGGASNLTAFLDEARKQSKDNWRPQYTAAAINKYVRAGFGMN